MFSTPKRLTFIVGLALIAGAPPQVMAAESPQTPPSRERLLGLAQKFVDKVGEKFDAADQYLDQIHPVDMRLQRYFQGFENGEPLLLEIRLGRLSLPRSVTAFKQDQDVMISLTEFAEAADFPIKVDAEAGTAKGWFIREEQVFLLDNAAKKITVKDKTYDIADGEVEVQDGDILIRGRTLSDWFGFTMSLNLGQQRVDVMPGRQKWPLEERIERERRRKQKSKSLPPPSMPRIEDPYKLATIPNIDVLTNDDYTKPADGVATHTRTHIVQAAGDMLGHTAKLTVTGDKENRANQATLNFSKTSDKQDLLGPLKARNYEFVDISTVNVPLAGAAPQEMGVRVSSRDPYVTNNTRTNVTGEATPGWDVELYRNDQFLASAVAGDDGRYVFQDVLLFAGQNNFKIVQYGAQGEVKEDVQTITVDPSLYNSGAGVYDVSASLSNTRTYERIPSDDQDKHAPHLAATYEYAVDPRLTLSAGTQVRQDEGEQKVFLQTGAAATIGQTILNADAAVEDDGAWSSALTARRNFGKHSTFASAQYLSEDYSPGGNGDSLSQYRLNGVVRGPLPNLFDTSPGYNLSMNYVARSDDTAQRTTTLDLTGRLGRLSGNNSITQDVNWNGDEDSEAIYGSYSLRGRALGMGWRTRTQYDVKPVRQITEYLTEVTKRLDEKLQLSAEATYKPLERYKKGLIGLTWEGDHATVSPTVSYDSEETLAAGLNVKFGLARNPYNGDIVMSGKSLTDKGGVAARVFLDKDGDKILSEGDELLEGVTVEAIHSRRRAETDENGEAFLYNLPEDILTDVVVQEGSMFDPAWISAVKGYSMRPRPGHLARMDFPIQMSGEIDGTVYGQVPLGKPRELRSIQLRLYRMNGQVEQTAMTASDGFYVFSRIPPGKYYLMVDEQDARNNKLSPPLPQLIEIGFEGKVMYGNNMILQSEGKEIPVSILADFKDYAALYPNLDLRAAAGRPLLLNLGSYNSNLLMTIVWYKLKTRYGSILGPSATVVDPSVSFPSPKDNMYTLRVYTMDMSLDTAVRKCRALRARGFDCAVELMPDDALTVLSNLESREKTF